MCEQAAFCKDEKKKKKFIDRALILKKNIGISIPPSWAYKYDLSTVK
jgi:hypothetical protein